MREMTVADIRGHFRSFKAAEDYFRRKVNLPSKRWDDLMHAEHASGFMVAGAAKMAILDDVRQAVDAAISKGETLEDFRKRFARIIQTKGWPGGAGGDSEAGVSWRTAVIYHTNLRTAYMAGRWETLKSFPYLQYQHNTVKNPREDHRAWDGKIIATNDPWWQTHYPPNGWGCRCTVTGVSEARLRTLGKAVPDAAPGPSVGDPPPEWAYHVGHGARSLGAAELFGQKVMQLKPEWRDAVLDDAVKRQVDWLKPQWDGMVDDLFEQDSTAQPKRGMQRRGAPVGFIPSRVVRALESGQGQTGGALGRRAGFDAQSLPSPIVFGGDEFIAHVMRDLPYDIDLPARLEALKRIPQWMQAQDAVYLLQDEGDKWALLMTKPMGDGRWWELVITRKRMRMNREDVDALHLTTLELTTPQRLDSFKALADRSW